MHSIYACCELRDQTHDARRRIPCCGVAERSLRVERVCRALFVRRTVVSNHQIHQRIVIQEVTTRLESRFHGKNPLKSIGSIIFVLSNLKFVHFEGCISVYILASSGSKFAKLNGTLNCIQNRCQLRNRSISKRFDGHCNRFRGSRLERILF